MSDEKQIIASAFSHLEQLEVIYGDAVPSTEIQRGFDYFGDNISLRSTANGIFKARQMTKYVLSIISTIPKAGGANIYKDYEDNDGSYHYSFEESSSGDYRNQYLIDSYNDKMPFIYFKAVARNPAIYQCIWPCYVAEIDYKSKFFRVIVGSKPVIAGVASKIKYEIPKNIEAKYYVRESKVRGHQAVFREEVLGAYKRKCAISDLSESKLLQAAHIVPDSQLTGFQTVRNGIALNNLHHRAYDTYLLGIDAEYKIHISDRLKKLNSGPLLDHGILNYENKKINVPRKKNCRPDPALLDIQFQEYLLRNT